jgi:hypothetical protein
VVVEPGVKDAGTETVDVGVCGLFSEVADHESVDQFLNEAVPRLLGCVGR